MDERDNRRASYDGLLTKALDPLSFKADAATGVLSGYASKFWVVDSYGECTAPGCFQKSITDRGPKSDQPRILLRYEHEYTIGTHTEMVDESTDTGGLYIEALAKDDGMYGSVVRSHLSGDVAVPYGLSIGFRRIGWRTATAEDPLILDFAPNWVRSMAVTDISQIYVLTEVKLMENSVVSFPAVDNALIDGYRSDDLNGRALQRVMTDLKAGRLTDAHISLLKQITTALPADVAPESQRDAAITTRAADGTAPTNRNYRAELLLAELGIGV